MKTKQYWHLDTADNNCLIQNISPNAGAVIAVLLYIANEYVKSDSISNVLSPGQQLQLLRVTQLLRNPLHVGEGLCGVWGSFCPFAHCTYEWGCTGMSDLMNVNCLRLP